MRSPVSTSAQPSISSKVTRWLLLCISAFAWSALAFSSGPCWAKKPFEDKFDAQIRSASERYLPGWDWKWWKAQIYQESRFNPNAVSPVGAAGLCQAMPATFAEWKGIFGWGATASPKNSDLCITGGAWEMARQRKFWTAPRSEDDRRRLAQAGYNAGAGNILKAQKRCPPGTTWAQVSACLPSITGRYAEETLTYVERINRWYLEML